MVPIIGSKINIGELLIKLMLFKVKVDSPTYSICLFYKHLSKNNNLNHSLQGGTIQNTTREISNGSFCMEYAMKYLSFVTVESPTNNIIMSERQQRVSFYDKLSTFGGILGKNLERKVHPYGLLYS